MVNYDVFPSAKWPSRTEKPAAVVRHTVRELEQVIGSAFIPGRDDLGSFQQVGLRLRSGRLVLLCQYDAIADKGTTIHIDARDSVVDAIDEIATALQLLVADFEWISAADSL